MKEKEGRVRLLSVERPIPITHWITCECSICCTCPRRSWQWQREQQPATQQQRKKHGWRKKKGWQLFMSMFSRRLCFHSHCFTWLRGQTDHVDKIQLNCKYTNRTLNIEHPETHISRIYVPLFGAFNETATDCYHMARSLFEIDNVNESQITITKKHTLHCCVKIANLSHNLIFLRFL